MFDVPCFGKHIPERLSICCSIGLRYDVLKGYPSGVNFGVSCHSSSVLLPTWCTGNLKVANNLMDCLAANVWAARHHNNMHHSLSPLAAWKPHQYTGAWRHRLKPAHRNMFIRTSEGRRWAEAAPDCNEVVSNQQSFIDKQLVNGKIVKIVLTRVLKPKANTEHLLWCLSVTVMIFKAYVTAVMNKLTDVAFDRNSHQFCGNSVAVLLQIYLNICVPKIIKIQCGLRKSLQK